jgi:uncharacterized repeat protein (TIGR01451 family)
VIPSPGGVITSWSYQAGATAESVRLDAWMSLSFPGQYNAAGHSVSRAVTPGVLNVFPGRISVAPGDLIGLTVTGTGSSCDYATASNQDVVSACFDCQQQPIGASTTIASAMSGLRVNASARLEPDADKDGYGDETQDQCLNDGTTYAGPCRADLTVSVTAPSTVATGEPLPYMITVTNRGPSLARGVVVTDTLPVGATWLPEKSDARCTGDSVAACPTVDIMPGGSAPTHIVASVGSIGAIVNSLAVSSSITDPDLSNNTATASTEVTLAALVPQQEPVFGGLAIAGQTLVPSVKRTIALRAVCPSTATGRCTGTVTLRTARKVALPGRQKGQKKPSRKVLTLGKASFSIGAKKTGTISVRLGTSALTVLTRALSLTAIATAVSHDAALHASTTKATILLVAPDRPERKPRHKGH